MPLSLIENINAPIIAVMVNWNGKLFLEASLSSLLSELKRHQGKLLLVDNASSDDSCVYIKEHFSDVSILQMDENLGGSGGFTAGMRLAMTCPSCKYIWLLDNDIVVENNALNPLLDCLESDKNAGAAGSQICLYDKPEIIQEIGSYYSDWFGSLRLCYSGEKRLLAKTKPFQVDYLAACSILIKRKCLEEVGLFADFFIFYDDVEWGLRAQTKGWSLWGVPASVIRHNFSSTKPTMAWREYYRKRNRLTVLALYPPKKGGSFASLLNLLNLNYLMYSNKWQGYSSLYLAYAWARQDALQGKLGKRDTALLNHMESNQSIFKFPNNVNEVLVDIGESAGDALFMMQKIRQVNPSAVFYLPKYLNHYFKLIDIENVFISQKNIYDMVITGRQYKFFSLTKSRYVYSYKNGSLVSKSYGQWSKDRIIKIFAIALSTLIMPYFTYIWFMRFKAKQYKNSKS